MSFAKRLLLIAVISFLIMLVYLFGFKKPAESAINKELSRVTKELESRGDGSSLLYGAPDVDGKSVHLTNVQYVDGKNDTRYDIGEVSAEIGINGLYNGTARNITITPNSGHAYTIASAEIAGFNDKSEQYEFEDLTLTAINLAGKLALGKEANMQIGSVNIKNLRAQTISQIALQNITIGNTEAPAAFNLENLQLKDVNYAELLNTVESLKKGNLPIHLLPLASINDIDMSGLNMLLGEDSVAGNDGNIDEADLFEFFLKNAPQELQDLVGTTDGNEIAETLKELQELPPEDQAIKGLELLLEGLKRNQSQ